VVPDFRPPTTVRFSPVALYTTYADVWDAIEILHDLASTGAHLEFENERGVVA
jgi:kynureninase